MRVAAAPYRSVLESSSSATQVPRCTIHYLLVDHARSSQFTVMEFPPQRLMLAKLAPVLGNQLHPVE